MKFVEIQMKINQFQNRKNVDKNKYIKVNVNSGIVKKNNQDISHKDN